MKCCCGAKGWCIAGLVIALIGLIFSASISSIISAIVDEELILQDGTIMYRMWEDSPVAMYMRVYMFHINNSEDVWHRQAAPHLQELGPYTFSEKHYRVRVVPLNNNTIQFQQKRVWVFQPELSNGTLSDTVTTVHPVVLTAASTIRNMPTWVKKGFNAALKEYSSELFITRNVSEYLFDGFADPLLNMTSRLPDGLVPPFDRFGWFYQRNGSEFYDGLFNIHTGADDISKLDVMDMWNLTRQTKYYDSYCGMVNGSFGEGWPPYQEGTSISMYSSDLCRSIRLDYEEDVTSSGVTFFKYSGSKRMFANRTEEPDNWCFEICGEDVCHPSGVVDTSVCRYGAPAFVSFPHYYNADPFYTDQVKGLSPRKELHEFYISLEPRTAVPLEVRARFQINLLMEPIEGITILKDVKKTFIPALWFGVSADMESNKKIATLLRFTVKSPFIASCSFFAMFCTGFAIVVLSLLVKHKGKILET